MTTPTPAANGKTWCEGHPHDFEARRHPLTGEVRRLEEVTPVEGQFVRRRTCWLCGTVRIDTFDAAWRPVGEPRYAYPGLKDLERWGIPGQKYVQTIKSTSAGFPGWMVYQVDGPLLLGRSTEAEVLAWLTERGYVRRPVGSA